MSTEAVPVSGYERGNGIKVSEHQRAPPGARQEGEKNAKTNQEGEKQERGKQEGDKNAGAKRPKEETKSDAPNKSAKTGEGEGKGVSPPLGEGRRRITVQELLELDLSEMRARVTAAAVGDDPEKAALVAEDEAKNNVQEGGVDEEEEGGTSKRDAFIGILETERNARKSMGGGSNKHLDGIIVNARAGHYDEGGQYGVRSLVPHLQSAGLFTLAKQVMEKKHVF